MNNITEKIKKILTSKKLKYGSNSVILIAVVIAIAVVLNMLVDLLGIKWDLTPNKLYSIGDVTKELLSSLDKDVRIIGLFDETTITSDDRYKDVIELLENYAKYPRVTVEYIDPDKNPGIIKELDPDNLKDLSYSDFVVMHNGKMKKLEYYDLFNTRFNQMTFSYELTGTNAEQGFTGAIKYVTAEVTPTVYFLEGHEETKIDTDYTTLKEYLERNNYDVKSLNLYSEEKVPDDAAILVVVSPKKDITTSERNKILDYIKNGGEAIFMFDPLETNPDFPEFQKLLAEINISINYDRVKENDSTRHIPNNSYNLVPILQSNSINSSLNPDSFVMIMPVSRSINILKNQKDYITITPLLKTSDSAVGEQIDKNKGADIEGPLDLAVAVEYVGGLNPSKILVMGNGSFMSDTAISRYQNYSLNGMYFFLNSLMWMQDKSDDLFIAPKSYEMPRLQITALQSTITGIAVVVGLPLIILITGFVVFLRRRHL
ncbi:MAG TPA: GldG family protein [Clostridiaceae bacterium]|nr:GldG family protein [Clostridiaceae bacterium]